MVDVFMTADGRFEQSRRESVSAWRQFRVPGKDVRRFTLPSVLYATTKDPKIRHETCNMTKINQCKGWGSGCLMGLTIPATGCVNK